MIKTFFFLFAVFFFGCSNKSVSKADPSPSNLTLTAAVHPANNGSVNFVATANNATSYEFDFGNGIHESSTSGKVTYVYPVSGNYTINVKAKNSSGTSVSKSLQIVVTRVASLVWSDEFDEPGTPNPAKWNFDQGTGENGWGNNELQYYTNRLDNVYISNGTLKIVAKKEDYSGKQYTSARLKTQGKFDFKYGKVEVRAKLPVGVPGVWPAIWMLGSNITSIGWPACGEIDIMEYLTRDPEYIYATFHYPGRFGETADGNKIKYTNAAAEFHLFAVEWTPEQLKIYVDEQLVHSIKNSVALPFNNNFFIILNMALGGNFGGALDAAFTNAVFEIDYVRVYQ